MISAASAQIETTSGDNNKILLPGKTTPVPDYSVAQEALIATAAGVLILLMLFGVENQARHFEQEKTAIEAGGGDDRQTATGHRDDDDEIRHAGSGDLESGTGPVDEKAGSFEHKETA